MSEKIESKLEGYMLKFPWLAQVSLPVMLSNLPDFSEGYSGNRTIIATEVNKSLLVRVLEEDQYDNYDGYYHYDENLFVVRNGKVEQVNVKKHVYSHGAPSHIDNYEKGGEPIYRALRGDEEFILLLGTSTTSGVKIEIYSLPKDKTMSELIEACRNLSV